MKQLLAATTLLLFTAGMAIIAMPPADLPQMKFADMPTWKDAHKDSLEEDVYYILVQQSEDAIKKGEYETAALRLVEAMGHEPDNPNNIPLLSNLGMIYTVLDKDTLALQAYDRALEKAPSMTTVLNNRARLYLKLGADEDAFNDFARVLAIDSLNTIALYYHGLMSLYAGDLQQCEKEFIRLKKSAPNAHNTAVALATLYSMTGRNTEAIPYFRKILDKDGAPEYYAGLAGCQLATGDLSGASETLAAALNLHPGDPELLYYRAWLNRDRYRLDDARRDAEAAIKAGANPTRVNALFLKKH